MSSAAAKAAVKRGVAFLDKADDGWWGCVDRKTFDITNPHLCVLGQVYIERYAEACRLLGIDGWFNQATLGFDRDVGLVTFPDLQEEWEKAIKAKQRGR